MEVLDKPVITILQELSQQIFSRTWTTKALERLEGSCKCMSPDLNWTPDTAGSHVSVFLNYFQTKHFKLMYLSAQEELGALLWICFTPNKRFSFFLVKKNGPKIPQKNRSKKCERPL